MCIEFHNVELFLETMFDWARQNNILANLLALTFPQVTGPFTKELIAVLPASVKYICHSGAGYDNIDIEACTSRGELIWNNSTLADLFD
jgi:lactate dehydrogenase-like 2-hydroxyacid dehydrogenase